MYVDDNSFPGLADIDWVPVRREFAHPINAVVLDGILCSTGPLILPVIDELAYKLRLFQGHTITLLVYLVWHTVVPLYFANGHKLAALICFPNALIFYFIIDQSFS